MILDSEYPEGKSWWFYIIMTIILTIITVGYCYTARNLAWCELSCSNYSALKNLCFKRLIFGSNSRIEFFHGAGHKTLNALYFRKNVCNEFSISFNVSCRLKIEYCICPQDYERFFEDGVNGTGKVVNRTGGNATKVLIPNF